jgi:predicted transcriptional regulator
MPAMTRPPPRRGIAAAESSSPARTGLGPLETRVLELLWDETRAVTVRHVQVAFPELAYTTLMTTLDRLFRKGLLLRRQRGRAFAYEPRCSRGELLGELVSGHVTDLLDGSGASTAILSTLVRAVGQADATLLDELDALVQAERRRLKLDDK